jgi:hypothetical protein
MTVTTSTSTQTYATITSGDLSFTNIVASETDIISGGGFVEAFTANSGNTVSDVTNGGFTGIEWSGIDMTTGSDGSGTTSQTVSISFDVTETGSNFITAINSAYNVDLASNGATFTATESIASSTAPNVPLATQTYTFGGPVPAPAILAVGVQSAVVTLTITESATAANAEVSASSIGQLFGESAPQLAALGDYVWMDTNRNGLQDSTETGVAGVTVDLLNAAGTSILAITTTNSLGLYNFTGLQPGTYDVRFVAPAGEQFTTENVGTNTAIDSNANQTTGLTAQITLTAGQTDNTIDAGLVLPAQLTPGITLDKQISTDGTNWVDVGNGVGIGAGNTSGDPNVLIGTTLYERVIAVNTGQVGITNASVTDVETTGTGTPVQFTFGGSGTVSTIAVGATITSDIATIASAALGYQVDQATINGSTTVTAVSATDQANYTGLPYGITLDKEISTNGTTWTEVGVNNISPQPTVAVGSTVYERVVIVNTGSVNIVNASVGDVETTGTGTPASFNFGSPAGSSFTLAAGATITSNVATLTAASGEELDTATVNGTATDSFGNTAPVTATDKADYTGTVAATPSITLDKQISTNGTTWVDVGSGAGIGTGNTSGDPNVLIGSTVYERVIAVNTGNVAITGASVSDVETTGTGTPASFTFSGGSPFTIAVGGTVTSNVATITAASGYELDTATIGGTTTGGTVTATDQANYTGLPYGITLDKEISTNGTTWTEVNVNNITPQPTVAVGSTVYERVIIVNTGSVNIVNASVSDVETTGTGTPASFNFGSPAGSTFTLAAGATITSNVATLTAASGEELDTATVKGTATDSFGNTASVTATDQADYTGTVAATPSITLDKQISTNGTTWVDVGSGVGIGTGNTSGDPNVLIGSTVYERVIAVNTGNVVITGASVSDVETTGTGTPASFTFSGGSPFTIAVGGTVTSNIATITAANGYQLDTATIGGTSNGGTVTASDQANYTGLPYGITLDKQISTDGTTWTEMGVNNITPEPTVTAGAKVYERVIIVNTGSVNITNASVGDVQTTGTGSAASFNFGTAAASTFTIGAGATITSNVATLTAASGQELDTATVNGTATDTYGHTAPVTASDQADYTGTTPTKPGLTVNKIPSSMVINQCGQETYTFAVTNTGSTAISNINIKDNIGTASNPDYITPTLVTTGFNGTLAAGATIDYSVTTNPINDNSNCCGTVSHTCTGSNLGSGNTAWFSCSFTPTNTSNGTCYVFKGVQCNVNGQGTGSGGYNVDCPDATVTFSSSCKQATTVYNSSTNCWNTTLPANCSPGSVFLTGCPVTVPSGCNFSNASANWSIADSGNNCGSSSVSWDASCAGYSSFNQNGFNGCSDYNSIGVKVCDNSSSYGNGGSCDQGYGYENGSYSNNCGGGFGGWGGWGGNSNWSGSSSDCAGTPENQYTNSSCGSNNNNGGGFGGYGGNGGGCNTGGCGNSGSGTCGQTQVGATGVADTVTVTGTSGGTTVTASDTAEVIVLGAKSNVSVNGSEPTGSLSSLYGKAQTLEFVYNPSTTVSTKTTSIGASTGSTPPSPAFIAITNNSNPNASGAQVYFEGTVATGQELYADASINSLTNTPNTGTAAFMSTVSGQGIFADIYASQAAFLAGAAPVQVDTYNTSGSKAMFAGDQIGSLKVVGYVGSTGGHLTT